MRLLGASVSQFAQAQPAHSPLKEASQLCQHWTPHSPDSHHRHCWPDDNPLPLPAALAAWGAYSRGPSLPRTTTTSPCHRILGCSRVRTHPIRRHQLLYDCSIDSRPASPHGHTSSPTSTVPACGDEPLPQQLHSPGSCSTLPWSCHPVVMGPAHTLCPSPRPSYPST